jgi:hypothetical protein
METLVMARVTTCPRCAVELFVPESLQSATGANCPECGGFIHLNSETLRELPAVFPSTVDFEPVKTGAAPTVSDLPSLATWPGEEGIESDSKTVDVVETSEAEPAPAGESLDEAAQRIDAWFRSAKTVADLPPAQSSDSANPETYVNRIADTTSIDMGAEGSETNSPAESSATVDLGASGFGGQDADADFELEPALDSSHETATWEDSQHMDRLLADIQDKPAAEFTPFVAKSPKSERGSEVDQGAIDWSPSELPENVKQRGGERRRKRSLVRTLAMTVISGAAGLAMGYYALLWMRGPGIDFLDVAKYIPKAVLPASFGTEPRPMTARSAVPAVPETTAAKNGETPETVAIAPAGDDSHSEAEKESGEIQASYTEPVEPSNDAAESKDKYASVESATASEDAATEPVELAAEAIAPLSEPAPPATTAPQIAGAPLFTPDQLAAALQVAVASQANLVNGDLSNSKEARTKGAAYVVFADLAQKLAFVDSATTSAEPSAAEQEAEELFRRTLADERVRNEIGQITPMWIAASKRQHGGVFFAGQVSGQKAAGSVVESEVDLGAGKRLTILVPPTLEGRLSSASKPAAMVGWIVDRPTESVHGYTGTAPQAIFVNRLIPLE